MDPLAGPSSRNVKPSINYVLGRKGTQVLVYNNKQYSKHKIYKNGNALWRCIKKGCNGLLTLSSMEEIVKIKEHKCASNVLDNQIKEAMYVLEQQVVSTMDPIPTIYKQKLNDTMDRGLNLVSDMPQFKNVKSGLYNKRNKSLGVNRLFAKSPIDVQVSRVDIALEYVNIETWNLCIFFNLNIIVIK
ncbi:hypothetical protein B5X24_HaOG201513 [Helicoverpa armigera]|nr:hypothetical protein B5X24_HaOG201513 [Helicoverpa armigera]